MNHTNLEARLEQVLPRQRTPGSMLLHEAFIVVQDLFPEVGRERPIGEDQNVILYQTAANILAERNLVTADDCTTAVVSLFQTVLGDHVSKGTCQFGTFVLAAIASIGRQGLLTDKSRAHLCLTLAGLDDAWCAAYGWHYPVRGHFLGLLRRELMALEAFNRHTDLVVRFKWAVFLKEIDRPAQVDLAIDELRALVTAIEERLDCTHDGVGQGPTPSGLPASPYRLSNQAVLLRDDFLIQFEKYRPLRRLLAQAVAELGRSLTQRGFGPDATDYQEATQALERAAALYSEVGPKEEAWACILTSLWTQHEVLRVARSNHRTRLMRDLFLKGEALRRQVLASVLAEGAKEHWYSLILAFNQRAVFEHQLAGFMRPAVAADKVLEAKAAAYRAMHKFLAINLGMLQQHAAEHPWQALACGLAGWHHLVGVSCLVSHELDGTGPEAEVEARKKDFHEKVLKPYLTPEVVHAFVVALAGAGRTWANRSGEKLPPQPQGWGAQMLPAEDIFVPHRHPAAHRQLLQDSVEALLKLAELRQEGFSAAQWQVVQRVLDIARVSTLPAPTIDGLRRAEHQLLLASPEMRNGEALAYLEARLDSLDGQLSGPLLSRTEKGLVSGWISMLVDWARRVTNDFATETGERYLSLVDRFSASAFRSEAVLLALGECGAEGRMQSIGPERAFTTAQELEEVVAYYGNEAYAWNDLRNRYLQLDFWCSLRAVQQFSDADPAIRERYQRLLDQPTVLTAVLPPDTELDRIFKSLGAFPEECDRQADGIHVVLQAKDPDQVERHVKADRGRLHDVVGELVTHGLLTAADTRTPRPDGSRVKAFLLSHPEIALLVPGAWPWWRSGVTLLHGSKDDVLQREHFPIEQAEDADAQTALFAGFMDVLRRDRHQLARASEDEVDRTIEEIREALGTASRRLAAFCRQHDVHRVVVLTQGNEFGLLPWETLPATDDTCLGDHLEFAYCFTVAPLSVASPRPRAGTIQILGTDEHQDLLRSGREVFQNLQTLGVAQKTLDGRDLGIEHALYPHVRSASRLRWFVHGHHDFWEPAMDHLVLADHPEQDRRLRLHADSLQRLPVKGIDCVELWACEGSAHGRPLAETGVVEEPEDLTSRFLMAGACRVLGCRWTAPVSPTLLLMECFSLRIAAGWSDVQALADAQRQLRSAFAKGGIVETAMRSRLLQLVGPLAGQPSQLGPDQREALCRDALAHGIAPVREAWYGMIGKHPSDLDIDAIGDGRLLSIGPSISERIAMGLTQDPAREVEPWIRDVLRPFRRTYSWAGWRVTVRDLEYAT